MIPRQLASGSAPSVMATGVTCLPLLGDPKIQANVNPAFVKDR